MCECVTLLFNLFSYEITAARLFSKSISVILMLVSDISMIIRNYVVYAMGRVEFNKYGLFKLKSILFIFHSTKTFVELVHKKTQLLHRLVIFIPRSISPHHSMCSVKYDNVSKFFRFPFRQRIYFSHIKNTVVQMFYLYERFRLV